MKILINSYNDADTIERTLVSVRGYEVHVFDGRYNDFPMAGLDSTDGTQEIVKRFPNAQFHDAVANESQCEKRTRMFSVVSEGEYCMKLDADEVLLSPIPELGTKDVYWGWTISNAYDYPYCKPYIFKKYDGMHYAGKHHYLFDKNKKLITSDQHTGHGYSFENLNFRVFNIRDRNLERDKQKLRFLNTREERNIQGESYVYGHQIMRLHEHRAEHPRKAIDVLKPIDSPVKYTFGLTFSRPWAIGRYFDAFDKLDLPPMEIVCIVDTNDRHFYKEIQKMLMIRQQRFLGIKTFMTGNPPPHERRMINSRRLRTVRALHIILTEAKGRILLGGEDDSLPEPQAYRTLIQNLEHCDFAQGTIVGRWQPIIPAWHVKEENGNVVSISTGEKLTGIEEIQGMGWYCFAGYIDAMRSIKMGWDLCRHIGADFHMGYDMWKAGYKLLHNHDVHVTHFGQDFELTLENDILKIIWEREGDKWRSRHL